MLVGERIKSSSLIDYICDGCGKEGRGNYYNLIKKYEHLCAKCGCKKGWSDKHKEDGRFLTNDMKQVIISRLDGKSLDEHLPKISSIGLVIKCKRCGDIHQTNAYQFYHRYPELYCISCVKKGLWNKGIFDGIIRNDIDRSKYKQSKGMDVSSSFDVECSICNKIFRITTNTYMNKYPNHKCNSCTQKQVWVDRYDELCSIRRTDEYRSKMSTSIKNSEKQKLTRDSASKKMKQYWKQQRNGYGSEDLLTEFRLYKKNVYLKSEVTYRRYRDTINPTNISRKEYHLDHKYSVLEGFKNNIPPYILADINNLQFISKFDNLSKGSRCDITKEELFEKVFKGNRIVEIDYGS